MKLQVISGSTRPNRTTPRLSNWVIKTAAQMDGVEVELIDLADYPMPYLDEPMSPRFNPERSANPQAQKWLDKVAEGDAYVFVTPEYNHSIPGELKNAIDYITFEMVKKPATVAAHGTVGGARATMHLKEILSESRAAIIPSQVALAQMSDKLDEDGNLKMELAALPRGPQTQLQNMLDELVWYGQALKTAREAKPAKRQLVKA